MNGLGCAAEAGNRKKAQEHASPVGTERALPPTPTGSVSAASLKGNQFRNDIQALRGLAVTLVVLYHAGLPIVPSGYLGVDIFFTISGFLITGIIGRGLDRGSFRFADFYARRARRLLPAAWLTLVGTTMLAVWLLTATQYGEYLTQLVGASTFAANIIAWRQTGYFATDAAFRPLIHMWSLAVEEQYYMLVPFALWLLPRRMRPGGVALVTAASFVLCLYLVGRSPNVAFFMLPTRAWELGIGSLGAFLVGNDAARRINSWLLPLALVGLLAIPALPVIGPHPGFGALAVCVATLIVLLASNAALAANPIVRALAVIGDFSYSLYLVHWPLLTFARVAHLSKDLSTAWASALVLVSLLLAFAMFRWVEEPFRHARVHGARLALICACAFATLVVAAYALAPSRATTGAALRALAPVEGLPPTICHRDLPVYNGECRQPGQGHVLLWGDSYSMHLVPGLAATMDGALDEASLGHCSPLLDYAELPSPNERPFSLTCMGFTRSVLDYIRRTPAIRTVILSASYDRTLSLPLGRSAIALIDGKVQAAGLGLQPTIDAQQRTVAAIRAMGRKVVVVSPTPPSLADLGQCWERTAEHRLILGAYHDCRPSRADAPDRWRDYDRMLEGFERQAGVGVIRLDRLFCSGGPCMTQRAGEPLFKDTGHLTEVGSLYVGHQLDLGHLADRLAR